MTSQNLLEVITQYLFLMGTLGQDGEAYLETVSDLDFPGEVKQMIRNCWVDRRKKALEEARHLLGLYEVNVEKYDFIIKSETPGPAGDSGLVDTRYHVLATLKHTHYAWVAFDISVLLGKDGDVTNPELQGVQIVDPNG